MINHQEPTRTQPLPGATRKHPHVADGNRVACVFSLKAEQMPSVSDFRERATEDEDRLCSLMSNSWFCLSRLQSKLKRIICTLSLSRSCRRQFAFVHTVPQTQRQSTRDERERCPAFYEIVCVCTDTKRPHNETALVPPCMIS